MGFQTVIICGNLGKDPEIRKTQSGKSVCTFSVGINEKRGEDNLCEWFDVVAWEKQAEICEKYLNKGSQVLIEGKLKTESWNDKETGQKRFKVKLYARVVTFVGPKASDSRRDSGGSGAEYDDEDIPF